MSRKASVGMSLRSKASVDDRPLRAMVRYGLAVASRFQGALPQDCARCDGCDACQGAKMGSDGWTEESTAFSVL